MTQDDFKKAFARRLLMACDGNPDVPQPNYGRLKWFVEKLEEHAVIVKAETVRKWFAGETYPRPKPMNALTRILQVDEQWLMNGKTPEFGPGEQMRNDRVAGAAVNLVAGFIQQDGGHPAFPTDDDKDSIEKQINLYAVIRGAKYSFHVTPALGKEGDYHFMVPHEAEDIIVLAVVPVRQFSVRIYELDWETTKTKGIRKGGGFTVPLKGLPHREIMSFSQRI